jgi:predicted nuclease of predicted toxin-antitoxin system
VTTAAVGPRLKLLIDACLTPTAIGHLHRAFSGAVDAVHVDAVLPPGISDEAVLSRAAAEGRAVVTANTADFLVLVRSRPRHPGMILVADQNTRQRQVEAVATVVQAILLPLDRGGAVVGHVFVWRRAGRRLAVRAIP